MRAILLVGVGLLLVTSCTRPTAEPLRLGLVAEPGGELDRAARLAVQEAGQAGGHPVELVVVPPGPEAVRQLAEVPVDAALVPPDPSLADSLSRAGLPTLVTGPPLDDRAHLLPGPAAEGRTLADLLEEDGVASVALLISDDRRHRTVAERLAADFSGVVTTRITLPPDDPDVTARLQELVDAGAEAVACLCERAVVPRVMAEAFVLGLAGRPWYYGGQAAHPEVPARAFPEDPGRAAGQRGVAVLVPEPTEGGAFGSFADAYQELTGDRPGGPAALVYDGAWLLVLAAQAGGPRDVLRGISTVSRGGRPCSGPTCVELLGAGADIDYQGASGPVDLTEEGTPTPIRVEVWRFSLTGEVEVLEIRSYRS